MISHQRCIRCKTKRAKATPSMCLECLRIVGWEVFKFFHPIALTDGDEGQARFKNWMNRT